MSATPGNEKDRWTPRLRGGVIYCSPGCGADCRLSDYRKAVMRAEKLAKSLGKGWKTEVWENMGWHWCLHYGPIRLCTSYTDVDANPSYFVLISDSVTDTGGGAMMWTGDTTSDDPREAIRKGIKLVMKYHEKYTRAVNRVFECAQRMEIK